MGDDTGNEVDLNRKKQNDAPQTNASSTLPSSAPSAMNTIRGQLADLARAFRSPFSNQEERERLSALRNDLLTQLAKEYIRTLETSWGACDPQMHRAIREHNSQHHANGGKDDCKHASHKILKELKRVLSTEDAQRLDELFGRATPLTEAEEKEFRDLVLKAIKALNPEELPPALDAIADLLPHPRELKGKNREFAKALESAKKSKAPSISNRFRVSLAGLSDDPLPRIGRPQNTIKASPYVKQWKPDLSTVKLTFSLPPEKTGFFIGGEEATGNNLALLQAAAIRERVEHRNLLSNLNWQVLELTGKIAIASPQERPGLVKMRDKLNSELAELRHERGLPQISIASLYFYDAA